MAATMTWADPSMARATGLDGLLSWLAIWAAERPARTCGLYCAPARMYRLAMSRNGTTPDWSALLTYGGTSKVSMSLVSSWVWACSGRPALSVSSVVRSVSSVLWY
jgi:hypothetical protein